MLYLPEVKREVNEDGSITIWFGTSTSSQYTKDSLRLHIEPAGHADGMVSLFLYCPLTKPNGTVAAQYFIDKHRQRCELGLRILDAIEQTSGFERLFDSHNEKLIRLVRKSPLDALAAAKSHEHVE